MIVNTTKTQPEVIFTASSSTAASHLVQSSRFTKWLAKVLLFGLFLSVVAMALLPWQQTSRGTGNVVAFVPQERQQIVKATAKGIIGTIADGLIEGKTVQKGEFLLEIQPFAGDMVQQLEGQVLQLKAERRNCKNQS